MKYEKIITYCKNVPSYFATNHSSHNLVSLYNVPNSHSQQQLHATLLIVSESPKASLPRRRKHCYSYCIIHHTHTLMMSAWKCFMTVLVDSCYCSYIKYAKISIAKQKHLVVILEKHTKIWSTKQTNTMTTAGSTTR